MPYSAPPSDTEPRSVWVDHTHDGRAWTVGGHLVRRYPDRPRGAIDEQERTRWLRDALDAAASDDALDAASDEGADDDHRAVPGWFARRLPDGAPAHRPDAHPRPDVIPAAVGRMLGLLHRLDGARCPTRSGREELVAEICCRVDDGRLRSELLPSPYDRYPAERLLELLDNEPPRPERLVVGHGAAVLANFWIEPEIAPGASPTGGPAAVDDSPGPGPGPGPEPGGPIGAGGFLGVDQLGLADRHADLAVIHRQLQLAYGPEAVFGFYEAYGCDPQLVALDHYLLIDALRCALVP